MQSSTEKRPDAKSDNKALKAYFEKVYPDMDFVRVYSSDMKKMVKWLEILEKNKIEIKLSDLPAETDNSFQETAKPKATETKAAAVKNAPPKKINSPRKMA